MYISFIKMGRLWFYIGILFLLITISKNYSLCTTTQSSCLICPIECKSCSSSLICNSCSQQYYFSKNACLSCSQYCLLCNSSSICLQCQTPYVLINGSCKACVVQNALTCSNINSALLCQDQFYVENNYCSSCLLNCKTCSSSSSCTQCVNYFYLNSTVLTCNPCPKNCLTCNSITPSICNSCRNGFQLDTNSACNLVGCSIAHCNYCSSNNICAQCSQFYFWDGNQCKMGASVLCQDGAQGPLPSHCINSCQSPFYQSQNITPFVCVPYSTITYLKYQLSQIYYYAFADLSDFQKISQVSKSLLLQSNNEYSYNVMSLNMGIISSFYKIQMRMKYTSNGNSNVSLESQSQASSELQIQSTTILSAGIPTCTIYTSYLVHSNNLVINMNSSISIIEIFFRIFKCPSSCMQCLNQQLCELCVAPNYMLGYQCVTNCTVYYHFALNRTCLLNCPDGYYYLNQGTNNKFCEICNSPCKDCLDSVKCLTCIDRYYFYNYTCTHFCPSAYFADSLNNNCEVCISPCKACLSKNACLSCDEGYWNGQRCTSICSNGTFGNNVTNACQNCDISCLTCINSSTTCASCINTLHLYNRKCVVNCPDRYFSSGIVPLKCIQCSSPCELCNSASSCLSCSYNFFYQSSCILNCPSGYFQNLMDNTCALCSISCLSCASYNYCTSCTISKCLYQGACVSNCPSTKWYQYTNITTNKCYCTACKYPCKQCTTQFNCLSCLEGYLFGYSCLIQCPAGYAKVQASQTCKPCNLLFNNCLYCNSNQCTTCDSSYMLLTGVCLSNCPQFYYQISNTCNKCIAPCLQCDSFSGCLSCISTYILYLNTCIISCPSGKYATLIVGGLSNSTCASCQSPCLYCESSATSCTLCELTYFLYNHTCYKKCSVIVPAFGFYDQPITSTCAKCIFPCKTCQGQYECLSCTIGYLNSVQMKCTECTIGTYPNNTLGVCQLCPSSCIICYTSNYCTFCNDGFYLFQNSCISNLTICQINGYYGVGRVCTICQQPCKTCAQSANKCKTCLQGYILFAPNLCLSECPNGYFRNAVTSTCDNCSPQCSSCLQTSTYCFGCISPYLYSTANMQCLIICPSSTYKEGGFCASCNYPCATCTSESSCLSCISGTLVIDQCYSSCNSGQFSNVNNICQKCQTPCSECSILNSNCTQCSIGHFLSGNLCLENCPSRTFADNQSLKCIKCLGSCYNCQSQINCTSCNAGLFFYISNSKYGQCASSCPNGYYPDPTANICKKCMSKCLTCTNNSSCGLCNGGMNMYQGGCYLECPPQMYAYQGVCETCHLPCSNCSDTTTCTSCADNSFLLVGSAQCIQGPICPIGYFLLDGQKKCNSQCPKGYYMLKSNRTCNRYGCATDQFKGADFNCYDKCPNGFIANSTFNCISCIDSQCLNGLFFDLKYNIQNDALRVYLIFTQSPLYLKSIPALQITPLISYNITSKLSSVQSNQNRRLKESFLKDQNFRIASSDVLFIGDLTIFLQLYPNSSLQQTYFTVKFANFLETYANPLQYASSSLYINGYDKYATDQLPQLTSLWVLVLMCAVVGLAKNPFMTDFAQTLFVIALTNLHYPLHLRSFLQSTKITFLGGFISIHQDNVQGKGKFSYIVNNGLLSNATANILLIISSLVISILGYLLLKFIRWQNQYNKVSNQSQPEQKFIGNRPNLGNIEASRLTPTQKFRNWLQQVYRPAQVKQSGNFLTSKSYNKCHVKFINRFVYFNYLPIYLFSLAQVSSFDLSSSINTFSSLLSILILICLSIYPFSLVKSKPKFTFLYLRKIVVAVGLILSVNYPAYSIGVISVCNITAFLLIQAYKLEKWKVQKIINSVGQIMQLILMIGFAIFIMIGEGNYTNFKVYFSWILIFLSIAILLLYLIFSLLLLIFWIIEIICKIDYIKNWIDEQNMEDSDATDSQTLNSSMKDHQQKKPQLTNGLNNKLMNKDDILSQNIKQFQSTLKSLKMLEPKQIGITPSKIKIQELYWNYDTNSNNQNSEQQNERIDKQPPKMLIRCINQFSDFQHQKQDDKKEND